MWFHVYKLVVSMPSFYRLAGGTIEVDGVRMHQTKNKTPLQDAQEKMAVLGVRRGLAVLDVCTGLGYSAIAAAKKGAKVTTIEVDEKVLELARANPDSNGLFSNPAITLLVGDALDVVPNFSPGSFDLIFHDPPRLSLAGELYSGAFYCQLFRILRHRGKLFHYTGNPGRSRGKDIPGGVKKRLSEAGFQDIVRNDSLLGFVCKKP